MPPSFLSPSGSTSWIVPVSTILARLDSMNPGGASADAAEIARIVRAVADIAVRLAGAFGGDELEGAGAQAAQTAGYELAGAVAATSKALAPVHGALTGAAGDLVNAQRLRGQVAQLADGSPGVAVPQTVVAARLRAVDDALRVVYNAPMSVRGGDVAGTAPGPETPGSGTPAGHVLRPAGAETGTDPATGGASANDHGALPAGLNTRRAAATGEPSGSSDPDGPAGAGPATGAPSTSGGQDGGPDSGAPDAGGPAPLGPASGAPGTGAPTAVRQPGGPATTGRPTALPWPQLRTVGGAPGTPATLAAARTALAAGTSPATGLPSSSVSARTAGSGGAVPSGGARAAEDRERRRPDYLLSTREGVELIGTLPVAGPAVLGDWDRPADADASPEGPAPDDSGSGEEPEQDRDFTL